MEPVASVWDYFNKIPALLNEYGGLSKPLLLFLLVSGALYVGVLLWLRFGKKQPVAAAQWVLSIGIAFLSVGGLYLKEMGSREQAQAYADFIKSHRIAPGNVGILVFDFNLPPDADQLRRAKLLGHMPLLVHTITDVLLDDLPDGFSMPVVIGVPFQGSPWQEVTQQNFSDIIGQLNALEILWGAIYSSQARDMAKVSLGVRSYPSHQLDAVIPLEDVLLEEDPRAEHQFGEGRFQLLGAVALGIALQTYDNAERATGDERRRLLLQTAQQITKAREALNNRRTDPALKRTLYSAQVTELLTNVLKEAGVQS
jgi:hypothetical protein